MGGLATPLGGATGEDHEESWLTEEGIPRSTPKSGTIGNRDPPHVSFPQQIENLHEQAGAVPAVVHLPRLIVLEPEGGYAGEGVAPAADLDLPCVPCQSPQDQKRGRIRVSFSCNRHLRCPIAFASVAAEPLGHAPAYGKVGAIGPAAERRSAETPCRRKVAGS